jgi:hypothetical protein
MAAKALIEKLKAINAPISEIRKQVSNLYSIRTWQNVNYTANYVSVEKESDIELLDEWLQEGRTENFNKRVEYWSELDILKKDVTGWLRHVRDGGHSVYLVQNSSPLYAYTIGLYYWYGLPEIAIKMNGAYEESNIMDIAHLLNVAALKVVSQKLTITSGRNAKDIWSDGRFDSSNTQFVELDHDTTVTKLGEALWFYRNLMDTEDFKCVEIDLSAGSEKDKFMTASYENEANLIYFKHGPVTEKPSVKIEYNPVIAQLVLSSFDIDHKSLAKYTKLDIDAPINEFKIEENPLLIQAAGKLDLERFKKVCEASNYDPHVVSDPTRSALHYAMHHNHLDNLKYLIEIGHPLTSNGAERSILMDASQYGFEDAVKLLVESGADMTEIDEECWTCLSLASFGPLHPDKAKAERIVDYLWSQGARIM